TDLYINVAAETKAHAAATARKQDNLILNVTWNANSCHCKSPALFLLMVAGEPGCGRTLFKARHPQTNCELLSLPCHVRKIYNYLRLKRASRALLTRDCPDCPRRYKLPWQLPTRYRTRSRSG